MKRNSLVVCRLCIGALWLWSSFGVPLVNGDAIVDFNELSTWTASGASGSYYNGNHSNESNSDGWAAGNGPTVHFGNQYSNAWGGFWSGFAYSNVNDSVTGDYTNQYAAITGTGVHGIGNYAIAYGGAQAYFNLPAGWRASSVHLTNTTYAWNSMQHGDGYAKEFGGVSGNDPDWFRVTLTGFSGFGGAGISTGATEFYLADFRFADQTQDYLVKQWTEVQLGALGNAASVRLTFSGSDVGVFGLNTPAYVALDHLRLTAVPEPSGGLLPILLVLSARPRTRRRLS